MSRPFRLLLLVFLCGLLLYAVGAPAVSVFAQSDSGFGAAQISGALNVQLGINPAVVKPGDSFQLTLTVSNPSRTTRIPQIRLQLPPNVEIETLVLPGGMSFNLQSNELSWLPVVAANGGQLTTALPLRAKTAVIAQPEQIIRATVQQDDATAVAEVRFWLGTPPQIDSLPLPTQVAVGQPVQLRLNSSGSGPVTQSWDLGDGRSLSVTDPTVVFPTAGVYQVTATAVNAVGASQARRNITVVPLPAAQFSADDFTVSPEQVVTFSNESGGQQPLQYTWTFGDGTTSNEKNPTHQYTTPGTYQVHLVVENELGHSEAYWPVTVGVAPVVEIVSLPDSVAAGQPLTAQANGDATITRYQWQVGNGRLQDGNVLTHTFRQTGSQVIAVTAFNEFGQTTVQRTVEVTPGTLTYYLPLLLNALLDTGAVVNVERAPAAPGVGVALPDVPLDAPFVMTPLALPAGMTAVEQLYVYINEARSQFDLRPLTLVPQLSQAAQAHTQDMAAFAYTGHIGSDGSAPAERYVLYQYPAGYAGEATAWGFEHPWQAVEFWVNSPAHRRIILNEFATDVGVGYTVNFSAPNVWYWTAEFGNTFAAADLPTLRVQTPTTDIRVLNTDPVTFSWNWSAPLAANQQFGLFLDVAGAEILLGTVNAPVRGTLYSFTTELLPWETAVGAATWQVRLLSGSTTLASGNERPLIVAPDPALPTPTPSPTVAVDTPAPLPTVTPTATAVVPIVTQPANPGPPPLVTATPNP